MAGWIGQTGHVFYFNMGRLQLLFDFELERRGGHASFCHSCDFINKFCWLGCVECLGGRRLLCDF